MRTNVGFDWTYQTAFTGFMWHNGEGEGQLTLNENVSSRSPVKMERGGFLKHGKGNSREQIPSPWGSPLVGMSSSRA